jgi:hypothetical protein
MKPSLILATICWGIFLGLAVAVILGKTDMSAGKYFFAVLIFISACVMSLANWTVKKGV